MQKFENLMKLKSLFEGINAELPVKNPEIKGIATDSRKIKKGDLFFAIEGNRTDGNLFIGQAIEKKASAVATNNRKFFENSKIPTVLLKTNDEILPICANRLYNNPSAKIKIVGITGTDGKTTVSYFIESIYKSAGKKIGVIGTINYRFGRKIISKATNTTPLASDIASMLARFKSKKAELAALEISAHSLSQNRITAVSLDGAIFTNFSKDHLDYYKTMDKYFDAKLKLFEMLSYSGKKSKYAILNGDDTKTKIIKKVLSEKIKTITFGSKPKNDWYAKNIKSDISGTTFTLICPKGKFKVNSKLIGTYNVYNALAAAAFSHSQKIPIKKIIEGIRSLKTIPGRMQSVETKQKFRIFIDFAHTPNAVSETLKLVKSLRPNKIYTVIGCGGDRDRKKRPIMAKEVCKNSDFVFFTTDNPRYENQNRIFADMLCGAKNFENYTIVQNRKKAVRKALKKAKAGDVVLLLGKGHEEGIIIKDKIIPYSDELAVKEASK